MITKNNHVWLFNGMCMKYKFIPGHTKYLQEIVALKFMSKFYNDWQLCQPYQIINQLHLVILEVERSRPKPTKSCSSI